MSGKVTVEGISCASCHLVEKLADVKGLPVCLVLSLIEVALVVLLYRFVVHWEGVYLQYREKQILDVVTSKTE